jgi:hypothetical protein
VLRSVDRSTLKEEVMKKMLGAIVFCLMTLLFLSEEAWADGNEIDSSKTQATDISSAPAVPLKGLLMSGLDGIGVGELLNKAGIKIYGYSEAGMM